MLILPGKTSAFKGPTYTEVFSDAFTSRSETLQTSSNWQELYTISAGATATVGSDQVSITTPTPNDGAAWSYTGSVANDAYAEIKFVSHTGTGGFALKVGVRMSSGDNGIFLNYLSSSNVFQITSTLNGTDTSFFPGYVQTISGGDVMRIEAVGTSIKGYLNGTLILDKTDTAGDHTSGAAGFEFFNSSASDTGVVDDFACGDIT